MKTGKKLLCALLLLLFTSEYVAATTIDVPEVSSTRQLHVVAHEIQVHFSLLAEESEERDHRDTDVFLFERLLTHPFHFPVLNIGKLRSSDPFPEVLPTVPRYTLHRSIII